ncbi:hypothetical protein EV401DRAFT_1989076 [Pisolithus croceorrhizus]|nr:hypothetical protein EV401DRAFT_1989076 [Pisolithus croceorrhizus]
MHAEPSCIASAIISLLLCVSFTMTSFCPRVPLTFVTVVSSTDLTATASLFSVVAFSPSLSLTVAFPSCL